MEAKLAERRKEYSSAEEQMRRALDVAPHQSGPLPGPARFLVRRGRLDEADQVLTRAGKASPDNPRLMYATAEIYIKAHYKSGCCERNYSSVTVSTTITPDDPPKSKLAKLLHRCRAVKPAHVSRRGSPIQHTGASRPAPFGLCSRRSACDRHRVRHPGGHHLAHQPGLHSGTD